MFLKSYNTHCAFPADSLSILNNTNVLLPEMKNIISRLFPVIILTLISCSQGNGSHHARIIWRKYSNGKFKIVYEYLKDPASFSDDYFYLEYYENGNIKIKGLENQHIRKGIWHYYYKNGTIKAKMNFVNDTLNGAIKLFNKDSRIMAKDSAENGTLAFHNRQIQQFINENIHPQELRPVWMDTLKKMMDSVDIWAGKNH